MDITTEFENICPGPLKLVLTHGLPRSGKSTWARSMGVPVVDPDSIRLAKTGRRWWGPIQPEIRPFAWTMVRSLFWAGHQCVILDGTSHRREWRDFWQPVGDVPWTVYIKEVNTPTNICIGRAHSTYPELVPVIEEMAENIEPIDYSLENVKRWPR